MSAARSDLCEVSPIAQRRASTRLDLPQPFGPTTPVRPGSIMKSVGSTKDLNPCRRRRVSFMDTLLYQAAGLAAGRNMGRARIVQHEQYHKRYRTAPGTRCTAALKRRTMAAGAGKGND